MTVAALGLKFEKIIINVMNGEHMTPEFLKVAGIFLRRINNNCDV